MESGRLGSDFRPLPAGGVALSVPDQCRVRDRSTIMARHLYADMGDAFADAQASTPFSCIPAGLCCSTHVTKALPHGIIMTACNCDHESKS